jgi:3'-phosphoadenosine 5'-phosphosulfate sulfotransferase (PAPS reductase)/FAD synthetase
MNSKPEWPVLILKIEGITPLIAPPSGWLGGSRRGETMQRYKYTAWRWRKKINKNA